MLITDELWQRPSRPPDLEAENWGLHELALQLLQPTHVVLERFVLLVQQLCQAETVGVSLVESSKWGTGTLRGVAVAGAYSGYADKVIDDELSPSRDCLNRGSAQLYSHPALDLPALHWMQPAIVEELVVPLISDEQPLGTVWLLSHTGKRLFDAEDLRLVTRLATVLVARLSSTQPGPERLEMQQSEQVLCQMADAIAAVFWLLDIKENRVLYVSSVYETVWGRDRAPLYADINHFFDSIHPDDRERVRECEAQCKQHNQFEAEYRIVRPDGDIRWVRDRGFLIHDEAGNPFRLAGFAEDITARKQAEDALRYSQERLKLAIEARKMVVLEWNPHNNTIVTTSNFAEIYGLNPAKAVQQRFSLIHPEDLTKHRDIVEQAIASGGSYRTEFRIIRPDTGETVWLEERGQAILNGEGELQKVIGVVLDISDHKQAEAKIEALNRDLQHRVNELQTLFDVIPVGILITQDSNFKEIQANPAFAEILGIASNGNASATPPKPHASVPYKMLQNGKEITPEESPLRRAAIHNTKVERAEVEILRNRDGALFNLYGYAAPLLDEHGNARGAVGAFLDITERKRIEAMHQILAEASSVLVRSLDVQTVLSSVVQLVVPTLADFCFIDTVADDGSLHRVAWHHHDPATHVWFDQIQQFVPPLQVQQHPVIQALTSGTARIIPDVDDIWLETIALDPEHLKFIKQSQLRSMIAVPLLARERALGVLTVCLTSASNRLYRLADRILAEELANRIALALDNARLYHQAQEANRIKDEFLAVLSHELRSPLNPILGWASLLRRGTLDETKTAQALETIERNAKLQVQLIEDLLDVSRILRGKMSLKIAPTNLATTIDAAVETVRLAAEAKEIDLTVTVADPPERASGTPIADRASATPPSPIQVLGDAARLQQIVWNLLTNAVKFTPAGGRVEVTLESVEFSVLSSELSNSTQHSNLNTQTSYAQITVRDTGKGIPSEFLPHVFDYFRQEDGKTTRRFGGLGLGLAIVRYLVEQHGGTVKAESPGENQGATFTVRLPLLRRQRDRPADPTTDTADRQSQAAPLEGIHIVAVDDEADIRNLVNFILEEAGATVRVAKSAVEALQLIQEQHPDVLLCDIGMPNVDGYMLVHQIRALPTTRGGTIPAIALTAYATEGDSQQAIAAGFQRHVAKPIEPEALVQAIAELIRSP